MTLLFGCAGQSVLASHLFSSIDCTQLYRTEDLFLQTQQLVAGISPFYIEVDQHFIIMADARIFNRDELIHLLRLDTPVSDAQLILMSYKMWTERCLDKLIGDYAFIIWSKTEKNLFLACDPMGQRTFYYSIQKNFIYFSNLSRLLFTEAGISRELNLFHFADYMLRIAPESGHTFFNAIYALKAGHFARWYPGQQKLKEHRYWWPDRLIQNQKRYVNDTECYNVFADLYQKVIGEQITIAKGPLASHLSGGLDSSSVTAMAANLLQKTGRVLYAFNHVPTPGRIAHPKPNYNYSDEEYIQSVVTRYDNIKLNRIYDTDKKIFEYCYLLHPWLARPIASGGLIAWSGKSIELARELGINVILCGLGGNVTLSWSGINYSPTKLSLRAYLSQLRPYPWSVFSVLNDDFVRRFKLVERLRQAKEFQFQNRRNDPRISYFNFGLTSTMASYHAAIRYLYGIEYWDPTLDRRIVEFCLQVPNTIYQALPGGRSLVRAALRPILPAMICNRTSRGLQASDWYKKIEKEKNELKLLIESWKKTAVSEYMNLSYLLKLVRHWDYGQVSTSRNRKYLKFEKRYYFGLLDAIETGLFIQNHYNG